jgi:HSP20 family protein
MSDKPSKNPLRDVRDSMGRLVQEGVAALQGTEALPVDVYQTDEVFVIKVNVIGAKAEEIDVTITENKLTIKGETYPDGADDDSAYERRERRFGKFSRSVTVPDNLDTEATAAGYKGGVLTITIPKLPEPVEDTTKVEIREG